MPNPIKRWFFDQMAAWCILFRRRDRALEFYAKMLELDPHDTLALASTAFQMAQQGRKREALAMFDRVLAVKPDDAEAHFNRGFLLQGLNDHEAAMAAFEHALSHNPDHDRACYGMALSLISTRRLEDAVAPLKRNTKLQPMSPYGWYQLATGPARARSRFRDAAGPRSSGDIRAEDRAAARTRDGPQGEYVVIKSPSAVAPARRWRSLLRRERDRAVAPVKSWLYSDRFGRSPDFVREQQKYRCRPPALGIHA